MNSRLHERNARRIVEILSDPGTIRTPQDALDLMMEAAYGQEARKLIFRQEQFAPEFFVLRTKLAGEILQKAANYGIQLAIVGDFAQVESESLRAFIAESNRGKGVCFVDSFEEALHRLAHRD